MFEAVLLGVPLLFQTRWLVLVLIDEVSWLLCQVLPIAGP